MWAKYDVGELTETARDTAELERDVVAYRKRVADLVKNQAN